MHLKVLNVVCIQVLSVGDIVIGEVVSKRPFGIFVKLKSLEFGVNRDFSDVDIQVRWSSLKPVLILFSTGEVPYRPSRLCF